MKELKIFSNDNFGNIRGIEINREAWLVGGDVAKVLGYSNVSKTISDHVDDEDKDKIPVMDALGRTQESWIISERGVLSLLQRSRLSNTQKQELIESLNLTEKIVLTSRKEIEFIDQLEESLKPFNLTGVRQYKVASYRIDYYIPSLNLAIEYDENDHKNYSYEAHEGRQKEIEDTLKCRFIRVTDDNSNNFNVGLVIKEIFNLWEE